MRIFNAALIYLRTTFIFLMLISGCAKPEEDHCLKTIWKYPKIFEIKLAVHVKETNPNLPGGTPGSLSPRDFQKMLVNGTIEKVECDETTTEPVNLGNSFVTKGIDWPAPIDVPDSYWIGHVVYVFEFDNDLDHINLILTIKITMKDNQSYMCNISKTIYYPQIIKMPDEMYYYILLDIQSNNWVKV